MRDVVLSPPPWAQAAVTGLGFGLANTVTGAWVGNRAWSEAAVTGAVAGIVFAAVTWPVLARQQRQAMDAVLTRSPVWLRRVSRTATRGPVPHDPDLREAAHRYALHQRDEILRYRRWGFPLLGVLFLLVLGAGLELWPVATLLALLGLHAYVVTPRRLARRAEVLAAPHEAGR